MFLLRNKQTDSKVRSHIWCPAETIIGTLLIPAWSHTFVEFNHEIISLAILFSSLVQEDLLSVAGKSMCTKYWLTV